MAAVGRAFHYSLALGLLVAGLGGCASNVVASTGAQSTSGRPGSWSGAESPGDEAPPRPADADAAVGYYRERGAALAKETPSEIEGTDFVRFRRGSLYLPPNADPKMTADSLESALGDAEQKQDSSAILAATAAPLANDQADIQGHLVRSETLQELNRKAEADFHRAVGFALIDSIVHSGDGHGFKTAWTVFRVKEEYEIAQVLGTSVDSQALMSDRGQSFDVLDVHRNEGGEKLRVFFNISELLAEEGRTLAAH